VLRAVGSGVPVALVPLVPLVMVAMDVVYALSSYPLGKLADSTSHIRLIVGLVILGVSDVVRAHAAHWSVLRVVSRCGACIWA